MDTPDVPLFLESLKRCLAQPGFLERFYDTFMASSDEVRDKFKDTDPIRQAQVLEQSLYALAVVAQGQPHSRIWGDFARLAQKHDRTHLDVKPEMYAVWRACLMNAVRAADPQFSPE